MRIPIFYDYRYENADIVGNVIIDSDLIHAHFNRPLSTKEINTIFGSISYYIIKSDENNLIQIIRITGWSMPRQSNGRPKALPPSGPGESVNLWPKKWRFWE